jgi:hypothetical protein
MKEAFYAWPTMHCLGNNFGGEFQPAKFIILHLSLSKWEMYRLQWVQTAVEEPQCLH